MRDGVAMPRDGDRRVPRDVPRDVPVHKPQAGELTGVQGLRNQAPTPVTLPVAPCDLT